MTNITATIKQLDNTGDGILFEAKSVGGSLLMSSGDTIDCSAMTAVASGDDIKIVSATEDGFNQSYTQYLHSTSIINGKCVILCSFRYTINNH